MSLNLGSTFVSAFRNPPAHIVVNHNGTNYTHSVERNESTVTQYNSYDTILSHKISKIYAYIHARENIFPSHLLLAIKHLHNINNDDAIKILNHALDITHGITKHDDGPLNTIKDVIFMIGNKELYINLLNIDNIEKINNDIKELPRTESTFCQIMIREEIEAYNKILDNHRGLMHGLIKEQEFKKMMEEKKKRARMIKGGLEVIDNICPITQEEIIEPALLKCGHMFEKSEIVKYRNESTKNKCPCCRGTIIFVD
jgi:hypothetical protein